MPTYKTKLTPHDLYFKNTLNTSGTLTLTPIEVSSKVTGDPTKPVAALITGDASKPVAALVTGDPAKPVTNLITGDPKKPVASLITGDPSQPVASTVEILNIPRLSKQDLKDLLTPEIRMRIPNYQQICFKVMGVELFSWCFSGESQVITEPYVPNDYENCETPCCEPDTRPFPSRPNNPDNPNNPTTGQG